MHAIDLDYRQYSFHSIDLQNEATPIHFKFLFTLKDRGHGMVAWPAVILVIGQ